MDKAEFIVQYQRLKEINNGVKPRYKDFLSFCNAHKRKLEEVFGRDAYTKLQSECGDVPNKLKMKRTPLKQILDQYGELVRTCKEVPFTADWVQAGFKPTTDALNRIHNLKWGDMPATFIQHYSDKPEWRDVITVLKSRLEGATRIDKTEQGFNAIVDKIVNWKPDRKRIIEETYKVELKKYLGQYFSVEEEVGDTNVDLLLGGKYPIEVKKNPTVSEYDRLLGQMIRHNKLYGSAIAIVIAIDSDDRFRKFHKLFTEVHDKLGMRAELINK